MTYAITISIGPVQGFISTARKTRDLWAGSHILSELSKAAARAALGQGVTLIFPPCANDAELDEANSIANIIVGTVDADSPDDVQRLVDNIKASVHDSWRNNFVEKVKRWLEARHLWQYINNDPPNAQNNGNPKGRWDVQTNPEDFIEFCAAWTPVAGENEIVAVKRTAQIMAGRKNCREFFCSPDADEGAPKSSLDGARATVLTENLVTSREDQYVEKRETLMLQVGERLDAIGLIKRLLWVIDNPTERYLSLFDIAIHRQLETLMTDDPQAANLLCQQRPEGVNRFRVALSDSLDELGKRSNKLASQTDQVQKSVGKKLQNLVADVREEGLYVAILLADGDKMGATLDQLENAKSRRAFSRSLAKFSQGVRDIVEARSGELIYAGGDDVLAILPVDEALDCAKELHERFGDAMGEYAENEEDRPTLSAGLAIVHYKEPLEDALNIARDLERIAKNPNSGYAAEDERFGNRNGLAIGLTTRGNTPKVVRERWGAEDDLVGRIGTWIQGYADETLPSRFAYNLYDLLLSGVYDSWNNDCDFARALRWDVLRIAEQKESIQNNDEVLETLHEHLERILPDQAQPGAPTGAQLQTRLRDAVESFANELVVARTIYDYQRRATPERGDNDVEPEGE